GWAWTSWWTRSSPCGSWSSTCCGTSTASGVPGAKTPSCGWRSSCWRTSASSSRPSPLGRRRRRAGRTCRTACGPPPRRRGRRPEAPVVHIMSTTKEADPEKTHVALMAALMHFEGVVNADFVTHSADALVPQPAIGIDVGKLASAACTVRLTSQKKTTLAYIFGARDFLDRRWTPLHRVRQGPRQRRHLACQSADPRNPRGVPRVVCLCCFVVCLQQGSQCGL
ncbi:unnamed protein product, partial [Prorocentrum cordatum]